MDGCPKFGNWMFRAGNCCFSLSSGKMLPLVSWSLNLGQRGLIMPHTEMCSVPSGSKCSTKNVTAYSTEPKEHLNRRLELPVKCGIVYKYREAGLTVM